MMALRFVPAVALLLLAGAGQEGVSPDGDDFFGKRVRPVLTERCFSCHGAEADRIKGGLRLDTPEGLWKGGDSGKSIVPGDPDRSLLIQAVRWTDADLRMPPKKKLDPAQIADLEAWVRNGARDPRPRSAAAEAGGDDAWAFRPLRKAAAPAGAPHPIDAFLLERLAAKGLSAAPPADRRALIRRATFDLHGLPPSPDETEAFVSDGSPAAFEKAVDRLLASPRYGEQWARHWLDVSRYADTSGFSNDFERPNAWRFRDYVIRSLNEDKPYGRFVQEQVAGDELAPDDPEMLLAVGFLRMGPWEHTAMSVAAVTRQQFLDDVTHAVASTFLGLTMRCARCHDHKFDPLPTRDYYRLQAVFAPTQFAERTARFLETENVSEFAEGKARVRDRLAATNAAHADLTRKNRDAVAALLRERGMKSTDELPPEERSKKNHIGLTVQEMTLLKMHQKRREVYERELRRYEPLAFSVYDGPSSGYTSNRAANPMPARREGPVQEIAILRGGALESPGDKVGPGVPGALPVKSEIPEEAAGRRLALARWIASPENPLGARVIVNRVWQHHFGGNGIVATPGNFGKMGKRPAHPELLDWLAGWFLENGGSLKKLHRLIMASEAYRRAGSHQAMEKVRAADPNNDLLAYYPPRRLAAEEMRDGMLAVSGELDPTMGGPAVFPEIHWELALQPRHIMGSVAPPYQPSPRPEQRNRRTIYAARIRTLEDATLEVFNRPGSEIACDRRDETTVTPQAFALFHGQFAHDRALAFARRIESAPEGAARVDLAFRLAYGRLPSGTERTRCLQHVRAMAEVHRGSVPPKVELPRRVKREMVEEFTGDVVTWEEELDGLSDYRRDLKPWDVGPETRAWADLCLVLFNSNEFLYVR
jgi:mono/diheme cytochrome c family protein/cytochrome c553